MEFTMKSRSMHCSTLEGHETMSVLDGIADKTGKGMFLLCLF